MAVSRKPRKGGLRFGGAVAIIETAERGRTCTCKKPDVCPANKHKIPAGEKHLVLFTPGRFGMERKAMCSKAGRHFLRAFMDECKRLHDEFPVAIEEHDMVMLEKDVENYRKGQLGVVVSVHQEGKGFTVEMSGGNCDCITVMYDDVSVVRMKENPKAGDRYLMPKMGDGALWKEQPAEIATVTRSGLKFRGVKKP